MRSAQRASPEDERQELLLQLGALDPTDYRAALRQILIIEARALTVERVNFWCLEEDGRTLRCEKGYLASSCAFEGGATLSLDDHPKYRSAVQQESVLAAEDAHVDSRTAELRDTYLVPLGITSIMDVPVWHHGKLAGILCHEHVGPRRRWRAWERSFALAAAQAISTSLEACARQRAERAEARAALLAAASETLSARLDDPAMFHRLLETALPLLGDWGAIDLFAAGRVDRLATAQVSPTRDERAAASQVPAAHVRATGEALLFDCTEDGMSCRPGLDEAQRKELCELGVGSVLSVPLLSRGHLAGALTFGAGPQHPPQVEDLEVAEDIALRVAVALDNARLYAELQTVIRARDRFLSVASHELYTPLSSLKLALEGLRGDRVRLSPEATEAALGIAHRQVERLERLIGNLLDVSRIQSGRLTPHLEEVDLGSVVEEVAEEMAQELAQVSSTLTISSPAPVVGRWDRAQLAHVVTNLLGNAAKFGAGAPIEVVVQREDETARLIVSDHGIGIPAEQLSRVLDPYERAVSDRSYGGLGLGLHIVRRIVEGLGGAVRIESVLGDTTTVTVSLPCVGPAAQARSDS